VIQLSDQVGGDEIIMMKCQLLAYKISFMSSMNQAII